MPTAPSTKRKICVVITARPSYSRVRAALVALADRDDVQLQVIAAASALSDQYGHVANIMEREGFAPDIRVESMVEGRGRIDAVETTAKGLHGTGEALLQLAPDLVMTVADRYETIATAIAASYMNIPLAHLQGGEVTGNIDEKVRHAITKLSDLHLVSGPGAYERISKMGEYPDSIHITGCPSIDVARQAIETGGRLPDAELYDLYGISGARPELSKGYIVVMQHPVTTSFEQAHTEITATLDAVRKAQIPALWFWPNVDTGADGTTQGIRDYLAEHPMPDVQFMQNMPPEAFIRLLNDSLGIVGNSSVAIRECAWLGVPAVNIGDRQQGRDRAPNVTDTDYDANAIGEAIKANAHIGKFPSSDLYGDGHAGPQIANVLATAPLRFSKRLAY